MSQKFFAIFLLFGFFTLHGMQESDISHEPEPRVNESKTETKAEQSNLKTKIEFSGSYKLKTQCALHILGLIKSGKLTWGMLSALPEGLGRFVELFHIADVYMKYEGKNLELSKIIEESKALIYELIDSDSDHIETFFAALDDFFDAYECMVLPTMESIFQKINVFVEIILGYTQANKLDSKIMKNFALNAANQDWIYIVKLMLDLNLIDRDYLIELFKLSWGYHCSAMMLRLLNSKIMITKNEFELMLEGDSDIFMKSINGHLDIVEYIVELIEMFELDINKIINKKYENGETLLIRASNHGYLDIVELLIAKGAEVNHADNLGNDALSYAIMNYSMFDRNAIHSDDEEAKARYIEEELSMMKTIIDILTPLTNRTHLAKNNNKSNFCPLF